LVSVLKIVFIGAPGAGKGTYAQFFRDKYCIPHISTGDIFREEIARNTELGRVVKKYIDRGELVPDDITIQVVKERLSKPDVVHGFILDGFPRTINQARALDEFMKIDVALHLVVSLDTIIRRLGGRRICPVCGRVYNIYYEPKPKVDEVCDYDGAKLVAREDDKPEIIKQRYYVFYNTYQPILNYYRETHRLEEIDADKPMAQVIPVIEDVLRKRGILKIKPCKPDLTPS